MMNAAKWIFMVFLMGLFVACASGGEEPVVKAESVETAPAAETTPEPVAAEVEEAPLDEAEQKSLKAQYAAEAETDITADNADEVATQMEKDIDGELAAEE